MTVEKGRIKALEDLFESKAQFHRDRAKLPFEEKIEIVVKLQRLAKEVSEVSPFKKTANESSLPVWILD
jgi:hypothetical protein